VNVHFHKCIGAKFLLVVGAFAVVFSCFVLYRTWSQDETPARELLSRQTELALEFDLAIRDYVTEHVRPFAEKYVGFDEFHAETMSSSFVARKVFEHVRRKFPETVIKFSSANPRNPLNLAGPEELEIIRYFEENPEAEEWAGPIDLAGEPHRALFRVRRAERQCLRCHGDPQDAPQSLLEQYGAERSFHYQVGDVMALDMVAVPSSRYTSATLAATARNSLVMIVGLCVLLAAIYFAFHALVARKLAVIAKHFRDAVEQEDGSWVAPIDYRGDDEIGDLAESFNLLAGKLHRLHQSLEERVAERTSELQAAVAERRQTEQELLSSKTKYESLYESSHDAIMVLTPGEGFFAGNPSTVRLFGCKHEEEFCACTPAGLSPEYQPDGTPSSLKAQEMMAVAMREGSHFFEWTHRRLDGGEFFATVLLTRLELEGNPVLQATVRDVTEQKRAEHELQKLSVAVQQSPATVVITDLEGAIEYVNPQFTKSTGYTAEEAIGQNPRILKSGDMAPETYRELWETILGGKVWRGEFHNRKKNGELYWEAASISPIFDAAGEITHFLAVKEDVSERKWAEVALVQAKQEAEAANCMLEDAMRRANRLAQEATAANTAKSEFLANMSHEIRTPMTAILGFSELLLETDIPDAERRLAVDTIRRNGEHLLGVINDILDISKIEAGKMAIERIACNPAALLDEVKSLMQVRADAKGLDYRVEDVGDLPRSIGTDPTRLRQILINVVGNAIKFTETGSVRLTARFVDGPQPAIQFDVTDTGIGMTASQAGQIFAPFVQADSSTARTYGGTGLGLALSKRLARLLGGDIALVRSKLEEGSHFRVTLPAETVEDAEVLPDSRPVTVQEAKGDEKTGLETHRLDGRILLAEDGGDNRRLISRLLEKAGAEVTVVENGQVAAEAALLARNEGKPFGLILMDMQMPVMSGYEAVSMLRECGYTGPIVALTANAMSDDRQKCLDAGCDDYISKPIHRKSLIETSGRHLASRPRKARSPRDA
jgi:PAS domain S-box-containing protein